MSYAIIIMALLAVPYGHNYGIACSTIMECSGTGCAFDVLRNQTINFNGNSIVIFLWHLFTYVITLPGML